MLARLTSTKLTLFLLGALAIALIPASISKSPLFISCVHLLLLTLAINLGLCTLTHWRRLPTSVMLIHSGVLVIFAGSLLSRAGFIATVNIYEADASSRAFRWDRQEDIDLGFTLRVNKIHRDYYPLPVRIGIIMDGTPVKLVEVTTGASFQWASYHIEALALDPITPALTLAITSPNGARTISTVTKGTSQGQQGLVLQLVAFKTPVIKRCWLDIDIISNAAAPFSGQAEVNRPMIWHGLRFYHTATSADPYGKPYVGIQIVNDKGIPLVYLGCLLVCLGNGLFLAKRDSRVPKKVKG